MKDLNELRDRAYKNACEHGFHDKEYSNEHLFCLVISELMGAVQAYRTGIRADKVAFEKIIKANKEYFPEDEQGLKFRIEYNDRIKGSLEDEMADACIRLLDIAGARNVNILQIDENLDLMPAGFTFTENVYYIIQDISHGWFNIQGKINCAILDIFVLSNNIGIDLEWHIEMKMRYNETSPYSTDANIDDFRLSKPSKTKEVTSIKTTRKNDR